MIEAIINNSIDKKDEYIKIKKAIDDSFHDNKEEDVYKKIFIYNQLLKEILGCYVIELKNK